jgi:hypothetical protein
MSNGSMTRRGALLVGIVGMAGCRGCILHPPVAAQIVCDGELDEPAWKEAVRTGPFVDAHGASAVPYSDARFVVVGDSLYVALYAADADITADDAFALDIGGRAFRFHPTDQGPDVGVDMDGTLDESSDEDEEWVIEARIPLAELPRGDVPVQLRRCDRQRDGSVRCGTGHATLRLP